MGRPRCVFCGFNDPSIRACPSRPGATPCAFELPDTEGVQGEREPVAWAPYMKDEDIPTPEGGLLYEGHTGRLIAYRTEQQARESMVHETALPLYTSPTPTDATRARLEELEEAIASLLENTSPCESLEEVAPGDPLVWSADLDRLRALTCQEEDANG